MLILPSLRLVLRRLPLLGVQRFVPGLARRGGAPGGGRAWTAAASLVACAGLGGGAGCDLLDEDDGEDDEVVVECDPVDDADAVEHAGDLAADEVWGAGLHVVTSTVTVRTDALLTLDGCATVRLAPDASLTIDDDAVGLVADGTATRPVVLERLDADAPWGSMNAFAPATLRLTHTTLRGGGTGIPPASADFAGATLVVRSFGPDPVDLLFVDHVAVEDSAGLGVMLQESGFLPGSTALTVRGAGTHPVYLGAGYATRLPTGTYEDNGVDAFLLQSVGVGVYDNGEPLLHDAVLPARGLPYQVGPDDTGADIVVGDGRSESPAALLRIEAGVELRFRGSTSALGQLLVNGKGVGAASAPQGALIIEGTADAPVVLTSMQPTPAPGDWQGLYFDTVVDERSRIEHAIVRFAGGETLTTGVCVAAAGAPNADADCAIVFFTEDAPPAAFVTDTTIEQSAGCGVYRGWSGDDVDFTAGNTFRDVEGCAQSNVPTENNDCDTGPCR
jgi:hypothetical protein